MMRIGVFGGSFDPVHVGHLWIGETAIETLKLDELRWVPAATSPLKPDGPAASDQDRLQMLKLALGGCPEHVIDEREIRRGDQSYSVDTAAEILSEHPGAELCMIIGSDSLATMPKWHQPESLLELVTLCVVQRGGEPEMDFSVLKELTSAERIAFFRESVIKMPVIEISSGEIRSRVNAGSSIRFRVPRAVEAFVDANDLYR